MAAIVLQNTIYKVAAKVLAGQLEERCTTLDVFGTRQLGFRRDLPGVHLGQFLVDAVVRDCYRRLSGELMALFVDLSNAFGSVSQESVLLGLGLTGLGGNDVALVTQMMREGRVWVESKGSVSTQHFQAGVPQGDPLSPILFCLAINPLLRRLEQVVPGAKAGNESIACIAFADDLVVLSDSIAAKSTALQTMEDFFAWAGLHPNCDKSGVMALRFRKRALAPVDLNVSLSGKRVP